MTFPSHSDAPAASQRIHLSLHHREVFAGTLTPEIDRHGNTRFLAHTQFPALVATADVTIEGHQFIEPIYEREVLFWSKGGARLWIELRALLEARPL